MQKELLRDAAALLERWLACQSGEADPNLRDHTKSFLEAVKWAKK